LHKGDPQVVGFPEANSQSFLAGDLVFLSAGLVKLATGTGLGASSILGVAMKNGTNNTAATGAGTHTPVAVVHPSQHWIAFPNTAVVPTASFTIGVDYKIKQTAAGAGEVSAAAGADAVIVGWHRRDGNAAGETMIIKFDADACQLDLG
jgi:hypothetical protein